eukprot:6173328-Pleurochrysis_carterae.AAC.3
MMYLFLPLLLGGGPKPSSGPACPPWRAVARPERTAYHAKEAARYVPETPDTCPRRKAPAGSETRDGGFHTHTHARARVCIHELVALE